MVPKSVAAPLVPSFFLLPQRGNYDYLGSTIWQYPSSSSSDRVKRLLNLFKEENLDATVADHLKLT
jgi:hypothetical protein